MKRINKRSILLSIMVLLIASLVFGCGKKDDAQLTQEDPNGQEGQELVTIEEFRDSIDETQIIAELDGATLTYSELLAQLEAEDILQPGIAGAALADRGMLEGYAEQLVIRKKKHEEAVAAGFTYSEEILEQEMMAIISAYPEMTTEQQGLVRGLLDHYIMITEYINSQVTDEQTRAFYEESPTEFTKASVRHILIAFEGRTEAEALELAEILAGRIRQGEDMAVLAEEFTEDDGSKEAGGLYENQPVMLWVPEFKEAALTFEIDVVGEPVRTQYGYHVMRVEDRSVTPYEQVAEMLKDSIASEMFMDYLDSVQGKATLSF